MDFEHKQYVLLAYLQKVDKGFKANNLADYLYEVRYHLKNIECFLTIKSLLDLRDMPSPTEKQRELLKKVCSGMESDPMHKEAIKIAKWASEKLQDAVRNGILSFKKIESNLKIYSIGGIIDKRSGYLLVRYAGSPVFESYKFVYDNEHKDTTFTLFNYYDMEPKATFSDVKSKILDEENKSNDLFLAVESNLSYDTRKSVFPVLNHIFPAKIFSKNISDLFY